MELLYEQEHLKIEYDNTCSCALMHWGVSPAAEQYREGHEKVLEALEISENPCLLIDMKDLNMMMSLSDQVWTAKDWIPRVMSKNVDKLAIVIPSSFVSQIAVKSIYGALPQEDCEIGFFDEFDEAKDWVSGVQASTEDGW